jgi:3-isopropylmalate/(R)-2-methylmalate dehydratase small subunit
LTSVVAPLVRDNVDTDAIIPAAYMRSLATDPGSGLFARWRYRPDGTDEPGFALNDARYAAARILLSGSNFGCGSSRENAVWALARFGFRCVVARGYGDIFHENCFKNGVLPIIVARDDHDRLVSACTAEVPYSLTVDVAAGTLRGEAGETVHFDLDERKRLLLLQGTDEIDNTLAASAQIDAFRRRHRQDKPWLYGMPDTASSGDTT